MEWGIVLRSADVAAGDTIDLRTYRASGPTAYEVYNVTPRITVPAANTFLFRPVRNLYFKG